MNIFEGFTNSRFSNKTFSTKLKTDEVASFVVDEIGLKKDLIILNERTMETARLLQHQHADGRITIAPQGPRKRKSFGLEPGDPMCVVGYVYREEAA